MLERSHANTAPPNHLQIHKRHAQPYPYRTKCLQNSETVWVVPGKDYFRCNTSVLNDIVPEPHTAGKASKKKRFDRKEYSRMGYVNRESDTKPTRRDGEAGRRYDQAYALGVLQQTLLATNPSLVKTAAASFGNVRCGWLPLKNNNICWDVKKYEGIDPLLYNRMDIFGTSKLIHEQSNDMIDDIFRELLDDFQAQARASGNLYFVHKLTDLINRIAKARETRGEDKWLSPAQLRANKPGQP
jgi:hypothetical protein